MGDARARALFATLVDHFHLKPAEIGHLTMRQVQRLYFHARDPETGAIVPEPETRELADDMALEILRANRMISQANYDEAMSKIKERRGEQPGG